MVETRDVLPTEDNPFLMELYVSYRREELAEWGWNQGQQLQFLHMQQHCQSRSYQLQYPNLESKIVLTDGRRVGRILTAQADGELILVDITLLPEFQNNGIGGCLLKQLQQQAVDINMPLRLSVLNGNRARRLYEQLGFCAVASREPYTIMRWCP